jgi:uncharacterized protein DUF5715
VIRDYQQKLAAFLPQYSFLKSESEIIEGYSFFIKNNTKAEYLKYPIKKIRLDQEGKIKGSVRNLKSKLRVYLLQYIEYCWYKEYKIFNRTDDILIDKDIFNLKELQKKYHIEFQYRSLKKGIFSRPQNGIRKRIDIMRRNPAGQTIGMESVYSRVEIIALINELNLKISDRYGKKIKLQINSILRTSENQHNLINIGYNATFFSSHCIGYAIDVERKWYALNDKRLFNIINDCLSGYHEKEIINLIDESIVWHLCLNPAYINEYKQKSNNWLLIKK